MKDNGIVTFKFKCFENDEILEIVRGLDTDDDISDTESDIPALTYYDALLTIKAVFSNICTAKLMLKMH